MISNVLARSAMRASSRQVARSDLYHFSNANGQNIPFDTTNKAALAVKMTLYLGLGFGAPFIAAAWQL
ncbi:Cytochrome c oxidase subunit 7C, mitochondrial [Choanephora cucurbitarum]|uniref:Cytochrome c oxidase subunit 8, mitochondrial n=1 Tax=Choanephora cucurbitarum TaxID=101091 RepID=A0A1C7NRY6_9FUNG|nr:Cytochrome c oxidase subunit 7C, mitochondrial [Choanephora cucurbitarum]